MRLKSSALVQQREIFFVIAYFLGKKKKGISEILTSVANTGQMMQIFPAEKRSRGDFCSLKTFNLMYLKMKYRYTDTERSNGHSKIDPNSFEESFE